MENEKLYTATYPSLKHLEEAKEDDFGFRRSMCNSVLKQSQLRLESFKINETLNTDEPNKNISFYFKYYRIQVPFHYQFFFHPLPTILKNFKNSIDVQSKKSFLCVSNKLKILKNIQIFSKIFMFDLESRVFCYLTNSNSGCFFRSRRGLN